MTRTQFVTRLSHLALEFEAVPPTRKGGKDVPASDTRDFFRWFDAVEGNDVEKVLYVATQVALHMFSREKTDHWVAAYFRVAYMVGAGLVQFEPEAAGK